MSTIHLSARTSVSPEQFLACLTDFGPGRSTLFGNSSDDYLKVHEQGRDHAEVTEGSGGIWERLRYDWSDPNHVVMSTVDSNVWGGRSGHRYTLTPLPDGGTWIEAEVVREGKNVKGKVTGTILATAGRGVLTKALRNTVRAVEARYQPTDAVGPEAAPA
jgi:hypothetical protein